MSKEVLKELTKIEDNGGKVRKRHLEHWLKDKEVGW
jgi:hypothetical protein